MGTFIITITPVADGETVDSDAAQTTLCVEAEPGRAAIKGLTVRVPEGASAIPAELLAIDLERLASAFATTYDGVSPMPSTAGAGPHHAADQVSEDDAGRGRTRAYRRIPDADELKNVYLETRSITGVADRFGVPVHTAQGWISRMRRKGVIPNLK